MAKRLVSEFFDLTGQVAVITGGAGLLGQKHAEAIYSAGGIPVLLDINFDKLYAGGISIEDQFGPEACTIQVDITQKLQIEAALDTILQKFGHVDVLINNAANNPKMEKSSEVEFSRLENFPQKQWDADISVGLTGAFFCSQVFGSEMARQKHGVILNVASDLGVIAPDQRLYRKENLPEDLQPVKPVTYSVVKTALIGLTRYLATYWADSGVRANSISPGGVYNGQPEEFIQRLAKLIPLSRMANVDEYQAAIIFLCSSASSYMTGTNLVIDGGRSCW